MTVELEEVIETQDGRVLAVERWRGRGRDGIEVDARCTDVYSFRDGLIFRGEGFRVKAEALEAVGLSEQDAHTDS
jgi:ketosteroid isomerase-like protein